MHYSIKQFSEMFDITQHTLRYYTDIGLLPCARDGGNRRIFDESSTARMKVIACLKGCGASIEMIMEYCELCNRPESKENLKARYDIILKQRDEAYLRLKEAQETVEHIENKVKYYDALMSEEESQKITDITCKPAKYKGKAVSSQKA